MKVSSTALFLKQPCTKSLLIHSDQTHVNKWDKSRVSSLLCTSYLREKEKILLIGAIQKPRALKRTDKSNYQLFTELRKNLG